MRSRSGSPRRCRHRAGADVPPQKGAEDHQRTAERTGPTFFKLVLFSVTTNIPFPPTRFVLKRYMGRAGRICFAAPKEPPPEIDRQGLFLIAASSGSLDQAVQQGQALAAVQLADGLGSIWRTRSRVTPKSRPTSSSVRGRPSSRPKRRRMTFSSRGVRLLRA